MREKSLQLNTTVNDFEGTISNGYNIIKTVLLFLLFIPFLGGKDNCLHAKLKYK